MTVRVQTEDFDLGAEITRLRAGNARIGAVASFIGTVRDLNDGSTVAAMELEHYPGMTERALEDIVAQARARWDIEDALVIHRIGPLAPLDQIVLVAVASAHRGEAFAACEFIMDYLKTQAPFWKREQTPQGARWVDARSSDDAALARWNDAPGESGS
jgi:molybdopterin synthase catalytic subunit